MEKVSLSLEVSPELLDSGPGFLLQDQPVVSLGEAVEVEEAMADWRTVPSGPVLWSGPPLSPPGPQLKQTHWARFPTPLHEGSQEQQLQEEVEKEGEFWGTAPGGGALWVEEEVGKMLSLHIQNFPQRQRRRYWTSPRTLRRQTSP